MSANNSAIPLPNPFTPLAFLPPDVAHQLQFAQYLAVAASAVSIAHICLPVHLTDSITAEDIRVGLAIGAAGRV
jgi:hypothetical protein